MGIAGKDIGRGVEPAHVAQVVSALVASLWLAGCAAVGPNFKPPAPPAAQEYAGAGDKTSTLPVLASDEQPSGPWWRSLGSAQLDQVMTLALTHNQTVAAAQATLERVKAEAEKEHAQLLPNVGANAGYQRERINITALGFPNFPNPTIGLYSIGPSVSYDLDLAGGGRRRVEAARARALAQVGRTEAAYLSLTGNVALQAVSIATYRAQIEGVQSVVADDRKAIDIVRQAQALGGDSPSASLGGEFQLQEDLARLPPLEQQLAQARHALAMLVGEAPSQWTAPDFAIEEFTPPATVPIAVPSALVRRRPDIQAAEAQLHADTAQVGVETARLYPDIRLVAGLTQEGLSPGSLFSFGATAYNFGPTATMPIFDGGAIRADRRAAQAQVRASLAQYRQTVITAFVQVSDVLSALGRDEDRLATLGAAETTARTSLEEARAGYRLGGAPLASVVTSDRQWRQASLARVGALGERLADIVELYGATASDWRSAPKSASDAHTHGPDGVKRVAPPGQSP